MSSWAEQYEEHWLRVAGDDPDAQERARSMISSTYSVMAEIPGLFDPLCIEDVDAYIRGEIDSDELMARTEVHVERIASADGS